VESLPTGIEEPPSSVNGLGEKGLVPKEGHNVAEEQQVVGATETEEPSPTENGTGAADLTPIAPAAGETAVQPEAVSMEEEGGEQEFQGLVTMEPAEDGVAVEGLAVEPAVAEAQKEEAETGAKEEEAGSPSEDKAAEAEKAQPANVVEGQVAPDNVERPSDEKTGEGSGPEDVVQKGSWTFVLSLDELEEIRTRVMSEAEEKKGHEEKTLAENLGQLEGDLRQGLERVFGQSSGSAKRPREEADEGEFTQRKKQRVAEEECAPGQTLRATELLKERERTAGDALSRCVCGEPLVVTRVHCSHCHCSAEKGAAGRAQAFSHWCDRPQGCLLLEEGRRVEASPATGPFGLPAGTDALEESQADLEVLEGLEIDLQAVFAEGLDYPGLGGVASAPFTSLARSPPKRVALNRLNRSPNPPASELGPPAVPFQDGFLKPSQTPPKAEQPLSHTQSFPLPGPQYSPAKPPNPLGGSVSLPADTSALVPYAPPAADVSESAPVETPRATEPPAEGALNPKPPASWLVEGQQPALTRLKMDLLDMEAALSPQCLRGARGFPDRCNAWRVMVKRAQSPRVSRQSSVRIFLFDQ
jgi:hypothetical protein